MERFVFENLSLTADEDAIFKVLKLDDSTDPDDFAAARVLITSMSHLANPKAILCVADIRERGEDYITVNGVKLQSGLIVKNVAGTDKILPFVCTCGRELEDFSATLTDPLEAYWAEGIKLYYLGLVRAYLNSYVRERYITDGHLSMMQPGSLKEWPLPAQGDLFDLIGGVREDVGVELTESFLMLPFKSVSGFLFRTDEEYHNCMLCQMENCPGRRAEYVGMGM